MELLTERKIKDCALAMLAAAEPGARIDLTMFYFSDRDLANAFIAAGRRGCDVRVILDPNKDAFGRTKNGIPNRQTAAKLVEAGIPLRWADTHGEQCHVKMLYVEHADLTATLLLGSCNYTRRNLDNFNAECNLALTAPLGDEAMARARTVFDRWWTNPDGCSCTVGYETYADRSIRRKLRAWLMETTGMGTF
jgi:phosphatidylserine/phosphatidylglycerophosphate/cardiolipin synthase-like enzyme